MTILACVLLTIWALCSIAMSAYLFSYWPIFKIDIDRDPDMRGHPYLLAMVLAASILFAPLVILGLFIRHEMKFRALVRAEMTNWDAGDE